MRGERISLSSQQRREYATLKYQVHTVMLLPEAKIGVADDAEDWTRRRNGEGFVFEMEAATDCKSQWSAVSADAIEVLTERETVPHVQ